MKIKCLAFTLLIMIPAFYGQTEENSRLLIPNKGVENLDFLSELEKEVVMELNLARTDPSAYAEYLIDFKRFYLGKYIEIAGRTPIITKEGAAAVNEAIGFLKAANPLPPLVVSKGISLAAKVHAADQGPKGVMSHQGSDNSSPLDRMLRFGQVEGSWGENIEYGSNSAREIIMQLIIDDGVPDRGHREKIFDPGFGVVGVNFGVHSSFGTMCVIDFAGAYGEKNTPNPFL